MLSSRWVAGGHGVIVGTLAAVIAAVLWIVRPLAGGPAASDAASSVLYWDRIASGRHLETFLNTTPKPLLTVVYGILHAIDGEWRLVSISAVVSTAIGIVLAGEVVRRVAGPAGAAFAVVALTGCLPLLANTSWAYGLGWALAFWMAAALALLRPSPRYGLAGGLLAIAALARPETYLLLGVGVILLIGARLAGRPAPRRAWLITIGFAGLLGMGLHDVLLTGDPIWWTSVAPHAVAVNDGRSRSLPSTIRIGAVLLIGQLPLAIGAAIGGLILLRRRQWLAVAGLVTLGPLVLLETWALAWRHLEVVGHYLHPVTIALTLGSAVTVGAAATALGTWLDARVPRFERRPRVGLAIAAAAALAILLARPFVPLSAGGRSTVALEGVLDARASAAMAMVRASMPSPIPAPSPPGALGAGDPSLVTVYVPRHRLARSAIDLGLNLTSITVLDVRRVDLAAGYPRAGSIVYLDGRIDPGSMTDATAALRVDTPTAVGSVRIVPIHVDASEKIWIVLVMPSTSATGPDVGG
jgi:hypothetical protein